MKSSTETDPHRCLEGCLLLASLFGLQDNIFFIYLELSFKELQEKLDIYEELDVRYVT